MSGLRISKVAIRALSLGAVTWALAGCGGSGHAKTAGNTSTDRAQTSTQATSTAGGASFIASTGAICTHRGPEVEAANIYTSNLAAIVVAAGKRAGIEREGLHELEALHPPSSMVSQWKIYIADAKNALADLTKLGESGTRPERALLEPLYSAYIQALEAMRAEAQQLSLAGCTKYG
jgi:hypothetical protein